MPSPEDHHRRPVLWILCALALVWVGLRFVEVDPSPPATVTRALAGVRSAPSPQTGRLEVTGLPAADSDPAGLLGVPAIRAGQERLRREVDVVNGSLTLRVQEIARRLEPAEGEELVALNVGGWLIPFYGRDARRLSELTTAAEDRPWEAVQDLLRLVETRLQVPPELDDAEDPARRRELTRFFRELGDSGRDAEATVAAAVDAFRADARDALRETQGPFQRRGPGRLLEVVLAALLGAAVRAAVRRDGGGVGRVAPLAMAPVLAVATVLALERTPVLAANGLTGLPLTFLPIAFALGFLTEAILVVVSRLDRLFVSENNGVIRARRAEEARAAAGAVRPANLRAELATAEPPRPEGPRGTGRLPSRLAAPAPATSRPPEPSAATADAEDAAPSPPPGRPPGLGSLDAVRDLAREVMARPRAERPRFEREVVEDPAIGAATPPVRELPAEADGGAVHPSPPPEPSRLPFSRKR